METTLPVSSTSEWDARAARGNPEMRVGRHTIVLEEGVRIEIHAPTGVAVFSVDDLVELRKMLSWYRYVTLWAAEEASRMEK